MWGPILHGTGMQAPHRAVPSLVGKPAGVKGIAKPLLQTMSHGGEAHRDLPCRWLSAGVAPLGSAGVGEPRALCRMFWGCQVCSGHTVGSASMFLQIPAPAEQSWSPPAQAFMIPERKGTNLSHVELSTRVFPILCPLWWMLTS